MSARQIIAQAARAARLGDTIQIHRAALKLMRRGHFRDIKTAMEFLFLSIGG